METMVTDDSEVTMDAEMEIGETENETVEPSLQKRRNTWPGSLQVPKTPDILPIYSVIIHWNSLILILLLVLPLLILPPPLLIRIIAKIIIIIISALSIVIQH